MSKWNRRNTRRRRCVHADIVDNEEKVDQVCWPFLVPPFSQWVFMRFKTKILLCLVLCCILVPVAALADEGIDIAYAELMPLATTSMLLDVTRTDAGFVAVGERGHIVISSDGENWSQADVVPTRATLTSVFYAGTRLWAAGHDAVILTSGDGGKSWTQQFSGPDRQQAVMDIYFTDVSHGVATGSYGLFLTTVDGGKTWEDGVVDPENDFHLNKLINLNDGRRIIAGEAGLSYRSFDDGKTWEHMDLPYQGSMWGGISLPNNCILFFGLRGHVLETCDFGDSWRELETGIESSISGAAQDNGMLVLVGNGGAVLSREGDGPFVAHQHSSGVDFAAVLALGDHRFLLVGEEGTHQFPESSEVGDD